MLVVGGRRGEKPPVEVGGVTLNGCWCLGPAIGPPVVQEDCLSAVATPRPSRICPAQGDE